jgi:hypothetical protein
MLDGPLQSKPNHNTFIKIEFHRFVVYSFVLSPYKLFQPSVADPEPVECGPIFFFLDPVPNIWGRIRIKSNLIVYTVLRIIEILYILVDFQFTKFFLGKNVLVLV